MRTGGLECIITSGACSSDMTWPGGVGMEGLASESGKLITAAIMTPPRRAWRRWGRGRIIHGSTR